MEEYVVRQSVQQGGGRWGQVVQRRQVVGNGRQAVRQTTSELRRTQ